MNSSGGNWCAHGWCGASTETNEPRAVTAKASVTKDERRQTPKPQGKIAKATH